MFCVGRCYVLNTYYFFWKDDLYSLIVYQHTNSIVRTEAVEVDAFFKNMEEPLAVTSVFYNAFLSFSSIRHEHWALLRNLHIFVPCYDMMPKHQYFQ